MDIAALRQIAADFTNHAAQNTVPADKAFRPELAGMRMYDEPILGVCAAEDDYLRTLTAEITGLEFAQPAYWLPGARSVISFFLPFTEQVRRSNAEEPRWPSSEWLHARIEGQSFVFALSDHLRDVLIEAGYDSLVPSSDRRFRSVPAPTPGDRHRFGSNWSERHVAYACGLGTFSLSKGLITRLGVAGRFGSVVTTLEIPPTGRPYRGIYEYCTACGACAANCPANAISVETGKDHVICKQFLDQTTERYRPYYGCGKCQVDVPCMDRIPG